MRVPVVLAVVAALFLGSVHGQVAKYCAPSDQSVCYSVNVPDQTASSGTGDVFFQISGPSSMQWIALGQGHQMAGANIFVVYANSKGDNVTLSPRLGKGNVEPDYNSQAQVFLLDGTGIANGMMTANVRCSSCATWSGGNMNLTSSDSSWIWAMKSGSPVMDDSPSADIKQHSNQDSFKFDLTKAKGGSSLNPFATSAATAPATTTSASGSSSSSGGDGDSGEGGEQSPAMMAKKKKAHRVLIAHGVIMSLAWVVVFPLGAIVIRLFSFSNLVWVHAGIQGLGYMMAIAGLGLGAWVGTSVEEYELNVYHPAIGLVVVSFLILQVPTGLVHHSTFKKQGRKTFWAQVHTIWGRLIVTLGIINGGLGLRLAGNTTGGEIAYGVVAGVIWLVWMGAAVWGTRFKKPKGDQTLEKP